MDFMQYISGIEPSPFFEPALREETLLNDNCFVTRTDVCQEFNVACDSVIMLSDIGVGNNDTKFVNLVEEAKDSPIAINDVCTPVPTISNNEDKPITIDDSSDDDVVFVGSGKVQFSSQKCCTKTEPPLRTQISNVELSLPEQCSNLEENQTLVVSTDVYSIMLSGLEMVENETKTVDQDDSSGYSSAADSVEDFDHCVNFEKVDNWNESDLEYMNQIPDDCENLGDKLTMKTWKFHRFNPHESEVPKNTCKLCFLHLPPKQFRRHTKMHEKEAAAQCDTCFLIFENVLLVSHHKRVHYKDIEVDQSELNFEIQDSPEIYCAHCDVSCDSKTELSAHWFDAFCDYCKQRIPCENLMKQHVMEKCEVYKKLYPCKFCKKGFKTSKSLSYHLKSSMCKYSKELDQLKIKSENLESSTLTSKCTNCQLFLPTKEGLRNHKVLAVCDERKCTRVFRCRTRFLMHVLEDYEFECSCKQCSAKFTSFKAYLKHKETCNNNENVCDKKLITSQDVTNSGKEKLGPEKSDKVKRQNFEGYITVGTLKQLYDRSRGTITRFAQKLKRMYPNTYGTHKKVEHLSWCIEKVIDKLHRKAIGRGDYFVPKRKRRRKIRRYY